MKICVAQTKPVKGDVAKNIDDHVRLINLAIEKGADTIIFPELSITGYEPTLAKELATEPNDKRFDIFQEISDTKKVTIGIGMPTKNGTDYSITMIVFQPQTERKTYSKQYLHDDETPFFVSGKDEIGLIGEDKNTAFAICYEISVEEHAETAFKNGAKIYIASVAKSVKGIDKALERLSEIASKYSMLVLMSNCVGLCDGMECAGKSSAWNKKGELIGQLTESGTGVLILDTETEEVQID